MADSFAELRAAAIDGRTHNIYYRQHQLEALHQDLRRARRPAEPPRRASARRPARGEDRRRVQERQARLGEECPPSRRQVCARGARVSACRAVNEPSLTGTPPFFDLTLDT